MYLADRNVFGVDLNPVAVELAEVSLWLNAIYGELDEDGKPVTDAQGRCRPRALVRLPALCRQQPHRRPPSGLQRRRAQEGRQARLV
jgi:hypothetical protein